MDEHAADHATGREEERERQVQVEGDLADSAEARQARLVEKARADHSSGTHRPDGRNKQQPRAVADRGVWIAVVVVQLDLRRGDRELDDLQAQPTHGRCWPLTLTIEMKPNSTRCPSLSIAGMLGESSRCVGRALAVLCAREAWTLQQTIEAREAQALRARAKRRRDYNRPTWVDEGVGRGLGERCVGSCERWARRSRKERRGTSEGNSGQRSARAAADDVRMQLSQQDPRGHGAGKAARVREDGGSQRTYSRSHSTTRSAHASPRPEPGDMQHEMWLCLQDQQLSASPTYGSGVSSL